MNKTELIDKLLHLGNTTEMCSSTDRHNAKELEHTLIDEYLKAINYSQFCETLPTDEQIYSEACIYVRKIENPRNYTNIKLRQAYKNGAKFIINALKKEN